jgi:hypothetical protein
MILYPQPGTGLLRAIYFDNEGHVVNYSVEVSADRSTVQFVSVPSVSGPRFRLTYRRTGEDTLGIQFEISPSGQPDSFSTYIQAAARRKPAR